MFLVSVSKELSSQWCMSSVTHWAASWLPCIVFGSEDRIQQPGFSHAKPECWVCFCFSDADAAKVKPRRIYATRKRARAEKAQFVCTYMAFLSHSQNAFHQWRQGHLVNELWACWEALLMNLVKTPGGAAFWRERSYVFGQDFQDEVKAIMSRQPNPEAKALGVVPLTHLPPPEETPS